MLSPSPSRRQGAKDSALERQTVRNRTNQRNFRLRRQEYVQELEAQIRDFREREIQATKEVQIAARAVAIENSLLRVLLKAYLHRTDRDIDMLLVHMRGGSSATQCSHQINSKLDHNRPEMTSFSPSKTTSSQTCIGGQKANLNVVSLHPNEVSTTMSQTPQDLPTSTTTRDVPLARSPALQQDVLRQADGNASPSAVTHEPANIDQEHSRSITDPQTIPLSCTSPQDSISCEEAAAIIAGLRLQHIEEIRAELGCASAVPCHVKNLALMQMMNETF